VRPGSRADAAIMAEEIVSRKSRAAPGVRPI
jgi:hypothetical protein